jgi:hypothetical protein
MEDTLKLWEQIKAGTYEVFSSYLMLEVINGCDEVKLNILLEYLNDVPINIIDTINPEALSIADEMITRGILREKSRDDCIHIALAVVSECDIIVSWNFNHIVNIKTINGIRIINAINGYRTIDIYSPTILLKGSE